MLDSVAGHELLRLQGLHLSDVDQRDGEVQMTDNQLSDLAGNMSLGGFPFQLNWISIQTKPSIELSV